MSLLFNVPHSQKIPEEENNKEKTEQGKPYTPQTDQQSPLPDLDLSEQTDGFLICRI